MHDIDRPCTINVINIIQIKMYSISISTTIFKIFSIFFHSYNYFHQAMMFFFQCFGSASVTTGKTEKKIYSSICLEL